MTLDTNISHDPSPGGTLVPVSVGDERSPPAPVAIVELIDRPPVVLAPQSPPLVHPAAVPAELEAIRRVLDNRPLVVLLVLFAGPLGLPALWLSRRFPRWVKISISVAFLLLTVVAPIAVTWYYLNVAVAPLVDAFPSSR